MISLNSSYTSNQTDLYELFKEFLNDDKVAKDIFTRFAKEIRRNKETD